MDQVFPATEQVFPELRRKLENQADIAGDLDA